MSGRLLWTGRLTDAGPDGGDGWDGWNADRDRLAARLDEHPELVLLDPVSFPWPLHAGDRADPPLTVVLPADLDAVTVEGLLGEPLLGRLTPYDRLVGGRPEVRAALERSWDLPPTVWADAWEPADDERTAGKRVFRQEVARLAGALRSGLADRPGTSHPVVALGGAAAHRHHPVAALLERPVAPLATIAAGAADAVAVVLPDGGQSTEERVAGLTAAFAACRPGGVLVVLAHVVTAPGGAVNPPLSELVGDLQAATGGAVHTDDLASVRWVGEVWARGVVLRLTSLAPVGADA